MNNETNNKPASDETIMVTFSYREYRIRVSRGIIRSLGKPPYVRLLINPDKMVMCIQPCDDNREYGTFKVPKNIFLESTKFRINSAYFVAMLFERMGWDEQTSYYVTGKYVAENNVVLLNLLNWEISTAEKTDGEDGQAN